MNEESPSETPEVEVTPGEVEYPLYRCKYGHEQRGSGETTARFNADGSTTTTGPVCVTCQLQWFGKKFPTRRVIDVQA